MKVYMGDFETTVFDNQEYTEVWAAACVELYTDEVHIFHSIAEQFEYFLSLKENIVCYYHNLKFDGSFWLSYLIGTLKFTQAFEELDEYTIKQVKRQAMKNNSVQYSINEMGQWYKIIIKAKGKYIELRDSLKLLPFSVEAIGQSFQTKHKKLTMEYKGFRYAGCPISEKERQYIANDVLVVKEALEIMFDQKLDKLTIGACALAEFKKTIDLFWGKDFYDENFPDLYKMEIDEQLFGQATAGGYVRKSYRGGWCYLVKGKENRVYHNGTTADVNSLYPSMMSSESGCSYPVGYPTFWKGDYIPTEAEDKYWFVRIRTRFKIKPGYLPFIMIKDNLLYTATEMLETSDVRNSKNGKYYDSYVDTYGQEQPARVTLTMTMTDYKLFREHYDVSDFEILDGCWFQKLRGIFDEYIYKYKLLKQNSTGALRQLAKLMLNSLYGKMAANTDSSFKIGYIKEDGSLGYYTQNEYNKKPGYIAIGSAITSYARNFTIRAAQANYHGVDKPGFIYADTDSIHCDLQPDEIQGIKEDSKEFCCWKLESCWDEAFFARAKTYIEHVTHENREPIEKTYYNIRCAGMTDRCKELFEMSMTGYQPYEEEYDKFTDEELDFLQQKREITDFTLGLRVPGKLMARNISGGILLTETTFEMR